MKSSFWREYNVFFTAMAGAVLNFPVYSVASQDVGAPIGLAELEKRVSYIRDFRPKDEFDVPPKISDLTNRSFAVTLVPKKRGPSNSICDGSPSWGYYADKQLLEVSFRTGTLTSLNSIDGSLRSELYSGRRSDGRSIKFSSFLCNHLNEDAYDARNLFGVSVKVYKSTDTVVAFAEQASPEDYSSNMRFGWSRVVSGSLARELSEGIEINISGVIGVWPSGGNLVCGVSRIVPTMDLPFDRTLNACFFKVKSFRFDVLNKKSGELLYRVDSAKGVK